MAKRRVKKRTHVGALNGLKKVPTSKGANPNDPKSMVIRMGAAEVGASVSQLVQDVRAMMEPGTASRLKERRSNRLRDYTTMAGPLGVTHLLLFSRSSSGNTNMRLALTPRGPTMHFQIESYSLCKDVQRALRHPKGGGKEFLTPPLLVMNNFQTSHPEPEKEKKNSKSKDGEAGQQAGIPRHLEALSTSIFQSLFPAIMPQTTPLSSIRRVLLLDRDVPKSSSQSPSASDPNYILNLRHYAISTKRTDLPRAIRKLTNAERLTNSSTRPANPNIPQKSSRGAMPNLSRLQDVSEFLLDPSAASAGYTSGSDSEVDTDAEVEVLDTSARKVQGRKSQPQKPTETNAAGEANGSTENGAAPRRTGANPRVEKRAVKLTELGPRLRLRLIKIEEGVCEGRVMWHAHVHKTQAEEKEMEGKWEEKRRIKEERKRIQRENVAKKKGQENPSETGGGKEDEDEDEDMDDWDSEDFEDADEMEVDGEDQTLEETNRLQVPIG